MRKLLKIFLGVFLFTTSAANSFNRNGFTERDECPILYEMTKWEYGKRWNDWGRRQNWYGKDGWVTNSGLGLYSKLKHNSHTIIHDESSAKIITYIGPWEETTLTYPRGLFEAPKTITKEIRLIAYQNGSSLRSHYEFKNDLNKNIPEQKLVLLQPVDNLIDLCQVRWAAKHGYNKITNCKLNPFRFFSGKVLNCKEGMVEAEE